MGGEFDNLFVHALTTLPNGDLIAGGLFGTAGGVPANYIARWDGSAWYPLGSGMDFWVRTLTTLPNGDLIAGGNFNTAGGIPASSIARWDGSAWSSLGSGISGEVFALTTLPNGDLIAGGYFSAAGGVSANNIARWDGSAWSPLGSGMSGVVDVLATLSNGELIAGGYFTAAGGVPANNIARWDGSAWSPLGSGISGGLYYSLVLVLKTLPNGNLIAGGLFNTAGDVPANNIARWDGSAWSPLGSGMTVGNLPVVHTLTTLPNGELIAGGNFVASGNNVTPYIARFRIDDRACSPCNHDFNQDENVDLLDAQQMAQVFVGLITPQAGWLDGDLNGDENADLTDAQLLAAYVVTGVCGV